MLIRQLGMSRDITLNYWMGSLTSGIIGLCKSEKKETCCGCNPQIFFHIPLPTMILPILPHQTLPRSSGASHPAVRKASLNGAWSPHSVSFTAMGAMGGELEDPCPVGSVGYGSKTSYSLAMSSWCLWMFIPRFI